MKRTSFIAVITTVIFILISSNAHAGNLKKLQYGDTLKILAIGNSFSDDGMMYLPDLLEDAGIHNVIVARLYIGGCSLQRHCREYQENLHQYKYYKSTDNKWVTVSKTASLMDGLKDEDWDIITMQESSPISGIESSYSPWLNMLTNIVRLNCSNPDVEIVWHQTWAYSKNSTHKGFVYYDKSQYRMFNAICYCADRIMEREGIDNVIPTGTAVQLLRLTRLQDENEFTRDGYHLSRTYGRYLAACTWFQALIKPTTGISVTKCKYHLQGTEYEIPERDAALCRKTAAKAVRIAF